MTQSLISQLREVDPYEFEHLIADLWEEMGFQTEVLQQSQDKGVDIRATNQLGQKHLIQVKRHGPNSVVGDPKIREYAGLYRLEDSVDQVYVVTTNGFTPQAMDTADTVDVELVNHERLTELITSHDQEKILNGHLHKPESESEFEPEPEYSLKSRSNISVDDTTSTANKPDSIPNSQTATPADIEPGAILRGEDLSNATLEGANLSGADLAHADLSNANLKSAELSGVERHGG
ncbi:MAG: restriction endonuclease [Haloquadratum sp. J07HQX50]|nr:MAG: restriction endonuclease [Haloquadratum sp. J07HQX50]